MCRVDRVSSWLLCQVDLCRVDFFVNESTRHTCRVDRVSSWLQPLHLNTLLIAVYTLWMHYAYSFNTTYLKPTFIYWWLSIRHPEIQVNVSIWQICHTATNHNPDARDLYAYLVVWIIRWQHTITGQIRRAFWRQPRRPRLIGARCTLPSRLFPLRFTVDRIVRVPLTQRKLVRRLKQHYNCCDIEQ